MNNLLRRRRAQRPMIRSSMSALEIEILTSAGKRMVEEELQTLKKEADARLHKKH